MHKLIDGSEGDVYRVLLLALSYGNPTISLPYNVLMNKIDAVCNGELPSGGSIIQACRQLDAIAKRLAPIERVLEWDDQELTGTMIIVNPYFLFHLRCSRKLNILSCVRYARAARKSRNLLEQGNGAPNDRAVAVTGRRTRRKTFACDLEFP